MLCPFYTGEGRRFHPRLWGDTLLLPCAFSNGVISLMGFPAEELLLICMFGRISVRSLKILCLSFPCIGSLALEEKLRLTSVLTLLPICISIFQYSPPQTKNKSIIKWSSDHVVFLYCTIFRLLKLQTFLNILLTISQLVNITESNW